MATGDVFACHNLVWGWEGAVGIWRLEARDAVKHPTVHGRAPITKNYSAQNAHSTEVKKPSPRAGTFQAKLIHNRTQDGNLFGTFEGNQGGCVAGTQ